MTDRRVRGIGGIRGWRHPSEVAAPLLGIGTEPLKARGRLGAAQDLSRNQPKSQSSTFHR